MQTKPRFLMVGISSELSTKPLAEVLKARGFPVSVVDLASDELTLAKVPEGLGPLVVVSSQHLGLTGPVYDDLYSLASHYIAPQTVRAKVGADLLVYVPHDRYDPLLDWEVELLQTMDLFIAPDADWWWAKEHVPTVNCGWVGSLARPDDLPADLPIGEGVFFPTLVSQIEEHGGIEYFLSTFERTLASGVAVKFPVWPGLDELSARLASMGVPIIEPSVPASAIIPRTPYVVTNGPTSIIAEAVAAGHRPVCVIDPGLEAIMEGHLAGDDAVVCNDADMPDALSRGGLVREAQPVFNVDLFLRAVRSGLRHA